MGGTLGLGEDLVQLCGGVSMERGGKREISMERGGKTSRWDCIGTDGWGGCRHGQKLDVGSFLGSFPLRGEQGVDVGEGGTMVMGRMRDGSAMRWRSVTEWGFGGRDWVGGQERERTVLDEKIELRNTGIEFAHLPL